jgi:hypothetical protein
MAGVAEEVGAFLRCEFGYDAADPVDQIRNGFFGGLA